MVKYTKLDVGNPVAFALQLVHQDWVAGVLSNGAMLGMFTRMISMIYSSSHLIYSIGRDGLFPKFLGKLNEKTHMPSHSMLAVTLIISLTGSMLSLDQLTKLVNIGTLMAFTFVSAGIIPLRKRQDIPNKDGFKVPFYPVLPIISVLICIVMLTQLSQETWLMFVVWVVIGTLIYITYGIKHSKLAHNKN